MTSPEGRDLVRQAGRLLQWGLRPHARPAQEAEYRELIERYFDDVGFRTLVRELADGLGLHLLDVSLHGVVLAPHDDSVFALRPADFRPTSSKVDDRLLDGLAQVAIAATVFPRARDLEDDPDLARPPVTVDEVEVQLRRLCEQMAEEARTRPDPDPEDEERGLTEAWRIYLARLAAMETSDSRSARRATRSIIKYALDRLREFGCFTQMRHGGEPAWQPTRRYQVMVQELAGTRLFQLVREALSSSEDAV